MRVGVLSALIAAGPLAGQPAGADSGPAPRVRSSHAYLRAMISEAGVRSPTFRGIVAKIEATDGIVYVEHGACKQNVQACMIMDVTAAGNFRILRVIVDARQPDWDVMASIGHELRHALEVLENRGIVNNHSLYFLYAGTRDAKDRPFDTRAATDAGFAVRREVSSFAKSKLH
jgi:hypothetical protein